MDQIRPGERLAQAVRQRMKELRRSQAKMETLAKEAGKGFSGSWLAQLLAGQRDNYRSAQLEGLDVALDWPAGTCEAILLGDPAPGAVKVVGVDPSGETIDARRERVNDELNRLAQVAGPDAIRKLTDAEAVIVVIRCLSDDQYDLFSRAVQADPRYSALTS